MKTLNVFADSNGWTPASVGCHWTRGEYSISTYQSMRGSGYALYRRGAGEVGRYESFEEAAKAANEGGKVITDPQTGEPISQQRMVDNTIGDLEVDIKRLLNSYDLPASIKAELLNDIERALTEAYHSASKLPTD